MSCRHENYHIEDNRDETGMAATFAVIAAVLFMTFAFGVTVGRWSVPDASECAHYQGVERVACEQEAQP